MTRINVVPVEELTREHLVAEYKELPRVFGLVRSAIERGEMPNDKRNPDTYRLGSGHVRFFYPRLGFIVERHKKLVDEMLKRGYVVNYPEPPNHDIGQEWFGNYSATQDALEENRNRIAERLLKT